MRYKTRKKPFNRQRARLYESTWDEQTSRIHSHVKKIRRSFQPINKSISMQHSLHGRKRGKSTLRDRVRRLVRSFALLGSLAQNAWFARSLFCPPFFSHYEFDQKYSILLSFFSLSNHSARSITNCKVRSLIKQGAYFLHPFKYSSVLFMKYWQLLGDTND